MGYDGISKLYFINKKHYIQKEFFQCSFSEDWKLSDMSVRGNEVWRKITSEKYNETRILVTIISSRNSMYFSKTLDIVSHPYYYKCPEKMLFDKNIKWDEYSIAWLNSYYNKKGK